MSVVTGSNKRKFQRLDTSMPVTVESAAGRIEARIFNISPDGCQFEAATQLRPSELLTLSFGRMTQPIVFRAKVQWCVPKEKIFHYGTVFWALGEDAKKDLLKNLIQVASLYKPKEEKPKDEGNTSEGGKPRADGGPFASDVKAEGEGSAVQADTLAVVDQATVTPPTPPTAAKG
jgi:PilZ domain